MLTSRPELGSRLSGPIVSEPARGPENSSGKLAPCAKITAAPPRCFTKARRERSLPQSLGCSNDEHLPLLSPCMIEGSKRDSTEGYSHVSPLHPTPNEMIGLQNPMN